MKKILLATSVVALMSASQAFADDSDSFTGTLSFEMPNTCAINSRAEASTSGGATRDVQFIDDGDAVLFEGANGLDTNSDGFFDSGTVVDFSLQFSEGSVFCNYSHTMTVSTAFGGFAAEEGANVGAGSDIFSKHMPYDLHVQFWGTEVSGADNLGTDAFKESAANASAYNAATDPATAGVFTHTVTPIAAFHNDGDNTTEEDTTDHGLAIKFATDPDNSSTADKPYVGGTYTEKVYLFIGTPA